MSEDNDSIEDEPLRTYDGQKEENKATHRWLRRFNILRIFYPGIFRPCPLAKSRKRRDSTDDTFEFDEDAERPLLGDFDVFTESWSSTE
jgi:hypothetical protein